MFIASGDVCPVGVFDSGIGGLSVLHEIHRLLPRENLIYVGDSAHAPYGDRSAEYVRERSQEIATFLLDKGAKAIVIACNTATAEAASLLRETLDIPVIGMEPAIKPAAQLSKSGIIGVLATQRTINSERLLGLTERYAKDKKVLAQPCPGLVEQVESGDLNSQKTETLLRQFIDPLLEQGADALILGCTHYPFLLPMIRKVTGNKIEILETGRPVASQLKRVLEKNLLINLEDADRVKVEFYNSSDEIHHLETMDLLWQTHTLKPAKAHDNEQGENHIKINLL